MKRLLTVLTLVVLGTGLWAESAGAVGYWKSISDVKGEEGKVTALWQLSLDAQGLLQGTIVWVPGKAANEPYVSQKKELNGLPVKGTFWIKGLKKAGVDAWNGGTIVDIGNSKGDVYGCEVKVIDGGKTLALRGYIGIALLGRTQNWAAVTEDEAKTLMGN
jgi:uncharacterized protein (DUF2147 family)